MNSRKMRKKINFGWKYRRKTTKKKTKFSSLTRNKLARSGSISLT